METTIRTFQIQLSSISRDSFVNDLRNNGIKFDSITQWSLIVANSPKVRTAIQLVKERFGSQSIYITNAEC
jgi:hypothetical protein